MSVERDRPATGALPGAGELVVVWGFGRFGGGRGAARWLQARGCRLRVVDRCPAAELPLGDLAGVEVAPEEARSFAGADLVVVNPAIPPSHPLLAELQAGGVPLTQELDLFLAAYPGRVHAVSGTNGKSTTATLLALGYRALGHDVLLGGNIGRSLLDDEAAWRADQWAVVEVSSFQAARLRAQVDRLTMTPVTADHESWHGSLAAYRRDKLRLLAALVPGGTVHGSARCAVLRQALEERPGLGARLVGAGGLRLDATGTILLGERALLPAGEPPLPGQGLREDLALALQSLEPEEDELAVLCAAFRGFRGLPHRLREIGRWRGIRFVDNGVSTLSETTRSALEALRPGLDRGGRIHLVAGGREKGEPTDRAAEALAGGADTIHLFGEVATPLLQALLRARGPTAITRSQRLLDALDAAMSGARAGDLLLFSPAFASHDQYHNFEERAGEALEWWASRTRGLGNRPRGPHEQGLHGGGMGASAGAQ
ncbi:MAG: UDP-N-acetylmuramoyl-L-alanine--D-glutamate ligase [Planctomycetota bacterium]